MKHITDRALAGVNGPRVFFGALVAAICFEGLGRKLAPATPQVVWYFLKDVVLVAGLLAFGIGLREVSWVRRLYRGFGLILGAAISWTLVQMANPEQRSMVLAILGLRSYWLWWLAPLVVATALRKERDWQAAGVMLGVVSLIAGLYAMIQFEYPSDAPINQYAWGSDAMGVASVAATGRVRVTSTFSYLSGFVDLTIIAIPLLLALGLSRRRGVLRWGATLSAGVLALAAPMTGSRGAVLFAAAGTLVMLLSAGFLATRHGRRLTVAVVAISTLVWFGGRPALQGVESRFGEEDTSDRFAQLLEFLPPVTMSVNDYPLFGIGTGMQQNARIAMGVSSPWESEGEQGRFLIEQGPVGYLLIWFARLGLAVALFRGFRMLRQAGQRTLSGACLALAGLSLLGNMAFDHVWQALLFVAVGLLLRPVVAYDPQLRNAPAHKAFGRPFVAG